MLPKDTLERLVIEQLRAKALTDENLEELVKLANEELQLEAEMLIRTV